MQIRRDRVLPGESLFSGPLDDKEFSMRRVIMNVIGALAMATAAGCGSTVKEIPATDSTQKPDVDIQQKIEEQKKLMQSRGGPGGQPAPTSNQ